VLAAGAVRIVLIVLTGYSATRSRDIVRTPAAL
jgi:hypothetical protein